MLAVVQEGYHNILCIIQQTMASEKSPAAQLRTTLFGYVRGMLEDPLLYQVVMQSKLPSVQKQTAILQENLRQHRKSIAMLCTCLEEGIACGEFSVEQVELRAQGIWCCVYGLLERILIEQPRRLPKAYSRFLCWAMSPVFCACGNIRKPVMWIP